MRDFVLSDTTEARLQKLEELCAHQGAEIDTLSETIREQWDRIDGLTHSLLRLRDRLTEAEESASTPHENTKPPHY